ncbi:MAG: glycosyltransferase family 4 protein [Burkholderiales bacterium]|nr:glycosyltransferase family 4 protein [Anaerolineae bacterium]
MKVLIVHNRYQQPGGEDICVEQEAALLRRHGHEVIEYRRSNEEVSAFGLLDKLTLPKRMIWANDAADDLRALIQRERPEVAHFHNTHFMISPIAYHVCQDMRVPVVKTLHNYRLLCPDAFFFRDGHVCEDCLGKAVAWPGVVHACYRDSAAQSAAVAATLSVHRAMGTWATQIDRYIALTEFGRQKFIAGGLPAEKIVVKPNFIYPDPGAGTDERNHMLYVGRLSEEKGVRTLLQAWLSLRHIPLRIVGGGPLQGEMQTFIRVHQLENVELVGPQPYEATLNMLKAARGLVCPSLWYEGQARVIIEAFACGTPVITTRLGSNEEVVEDGRTGYHTIPGDALDLAAKIEKLWTQPQHSAEMGIAARQEFAAKFTAERNYERLLQIYEAVRFQAT